MRSAAVVCTATSLICPDVGSLCNSKLDLRRSPTLLQDALAVLRGATAAMACFFCLLHAELVVSATASWFCGACSHAFLTAFGNSTDSSSCSILRLRPGRGLHSARITVSSAGCRQSAVSAGVEFFHQVSLRYGRGPLRHIRVQCPVTMNPRTCCTSQSMSRLSDVRTCWISLSCEEPIISVKPVNTLLVLH